MGVPKQPKQVYVVRRSLFSIIKWDRVLKDINEEDVSITKYRIYRAYNSNLSDLEIIQEIDTLDNDNQIDTMTIDFPATFPYYKISAVNDLGESDLSDEATNIYFPDIEDKKDKEEIEKLGLYDKSKYDEALFG